MVAQFGPTCGRTPIEASELEHNMGIVYILRSLANNRYYIGSTNDLRRRLKEHQIGRSKYMSRILPFELVFTQDFADIKQARQIEYKLKKLKSRVIIEKIISDGIIKLDP